MDLAIEPPRCRKVSISLGAVTGAKVGQTTILVGKIVQVHVAIEPFLAALKAVYADKADEVEVIDFAGRDEALAHLCYVCAAMLSVRTPGTARRVADLMQLLASFLAENYTSRRLRLHEKGGK